MKRLIYNHPDEHYNGIFGEVIEENESFVILQDEERNCYEVKKQFTLTTLGACKEYEKIWNDDFTTDLEKQKTQCKQNNMLVKFLLLKKENILPFKN